MDTDGMTEPNAESYSIESDEEGKTFLRASATLTLAHGRMCSTCQACCSTLPIPQLDKPAGQRCKDQCASGCRLHNSPAKPAVCQQFRCLWLRGMFSRKDRPDRIGLVARVWAVEPEVHPTGMIIKLMEARPGALESRRGREFVAKLLQQGWPVGIRRGHGKPYDVLYPSGAMDRVGLAPSWEELQADPDCRHPAQLRIRPEVVDEMLRLGKGIPEGWTTLKKDSDLPPAEPGDEPA